MKQLEAILTYLRSYMTIVELFDEWPAPSSHEMIIIIDYDNNMYIE